MLTNLRGLAKHQQVLASKSLKNSCNYALEIKNNFAVKPRKEPSVGIGPLVKEKITVYADLSKFRLSSMVVLTTGAGFVCAGVPIEWSTITMACVGTALCAGSAGTFNQIFERDRDANMKRTSMRSLPAGKVSPIEATMWGVASGATGVGMLLAGTPTPLVAALGAGNIALYAGAYTWSKPRTELNTWIGALVGAIPPVMGWLAAGGELMTAEPLALGGLLFLWQFPHFFALSWMHREDYARGNFKMIATNDPDGMRSANLIGEYSLYLTAFPIITSVAGLTSYMYSVEGTAANAYLLYLAYKFKQNRSNANARKIFLCSLWYLPLLLAGYVFHSRMWAENKNKDNKAILLENDAESVLSLGPIVTAGREVGKQLCPHEMFVTPSVVGDGTLTVVGSTQNSNNEKISGQQEAVGVAPHLCLKLGANKVRFVSINVDADHTTYRDIMELTYCTLYLR